MNVDLSWHHSSEYVSVYNYLGAKGDWSNLWIKPTSRVDLSIGYTITPTWTANLAVSNLTKTDRYWAHVTHHSTVLSDVVDAGATGLFTLTHTF